MAVLDTRTPAKGRFEADLVDARNRPGLFTAEQTEAGIELTARIGRLGDAAAQRELLRRVALRLKQLDGRGVAPIDWN